ncbi:hypothetical protein B0H13DRAFT_1887821 [Mycena leptocephala]|nr:hypothetical protein B0H13DRAFT_1887821 [Mycena leptocephala]
MACTCLSACLSVVPVILPLVSVAPDGSGSGTFRRFGLHTFSGASPVSLRTISRVGAASLAGLSAAYYRRRHSFLLSVVGAQAGNLFDPSGETRFLFWGPVLERYIRFESEACLYAASTLEYRHLESVANSGSTCDFCATSDMFSRYI